MDSFISVLQSSAESRPYLGAVSLVILLWATYTLVFQKPRLPDVEFLRICNKPGKAGDADDVKALLDDSLSAILKGYKQVLPNTHRLISVALT